MKSCHCSKINLCRNIILTVSKEFKFALSALSTLSNSPKTSQFSHLVFVRSSMEEVVHRSAVKFTSRKRKVKWMKKKSTDNYRSKSGKFSIYYTLNRSANIAMSELELWKVDWKLNGNTQNLWMFAVFFGVKKWKKAWKIKFIVLFNECNWK